MIHSEKGFSPLLLKGFDIFGGGDVVLVRKVGYSPISLVFYCNFEGRGPWAVDIRYAFLHHPAELFAVECVKRTSSVGAGLTNTNRWHSYLRFSVGEFLGWRPNRKRWSTVNETEEAFVERVMNEIAVNLIPQLEAVDNERALVQALLDADENGHRSWWRTNGAIRAAAILYIGNRLHQDSSELVSQLMEFANHISLGLEGRVVAGAPEAFLANAVAELKE